MWGQSHKNTKYYLKNCVYGPLPSPALLTFRLGCAWPFDCSEEREAPLFNQFGSAVDITSKCTVIVKILTNVMHRFERKRVADRFRKAEAVLDTADQQNPNPFQINGPI